MNTKTSGSYISIENCLKIGNVEGLKFIDEFGVMFEKFNVIQNIFLIKPNVTVYGK